MSIFSPGSLGIGIDSGTPHLERGYWNAAVPSTCVVPLQQHTGSRIEPLVSLGDFVREGMVIAESDRRLSLPLHAPIPGRVSAIGQVRLFDGTTSQGLSIELDGEFDRLGKEVEPVLWRELSRNELLQRLRAAGVVGGSRSAVPAHLYLGLIRSSRQRVLILNLSEHEPYMTSGIEVAVAQPDDVLSGLEIAAAITESTSIHVVFGSQHRSRLKHILSKARDRGYRVHRLPAMYPGVTSYNAGQVIGGAGKKIDRDDDVYILPPETAQAIHDAVVFDKPQIDRVVAVGGGAVRRPAHVRVRIGTSIGDVLSECGGLTEEPARILVGGPISGRHVTNINAPITKTTPAVVALTRDELQAGREEPCIGCGACIRACPVSINPQLLHRLIVAERTEEMIPNGIFDCVECSLCSHVCPSRIPLVGRFRELKEKLHSREAGV